MSDLSVLAQQYETVAELSQAVSEAVIALKKAHLGLPGVDLLTPQELETYRKRLANITAALAEQLDPGGVNDLPETSQVTGWLVARLRTTQQGNLTYFAEDLRRTAARLRCSPAELSQGDLMLLDQLATAADAETSHVFRRLMRV